MSALETTRDGIVRTLTPALTLEDQLERAEFDLVRADYAESTAKMLREKEEARARIAEIKRQMQQREMARQAEVERRHLQNAVSSLGDRHAG